jgi:hypothetical protein
VVVPVRPLAQEQQDEREQNDQNKENNRYRRPLADVVVGEGDAVEVEVDRLRRAARPALRDSKLFTASTIRTMAAMNRKAVISGRVVKRNTCHTEAPSIMALS